MGILAEPIADHLPIFTATVMKKHVNDSLKTSDVKFNDKNINALINRLTDKNWQIEIGTDVDKCYNDFHDTFFSVYNSFLTPVNLNRKRVKIKTPWMTDELLQLIKKKERLYLKYLLKQTTESEQEYKRINNVVSKLKRVKKKDYYVNLLAECSDYKKVENSK